MTADILRTSILHGRIAGTRKRGRPRRRWTDIKDLPVATVDVLASWWPVRLGCYREVAVSTFIRPVQTALKSDTIMNSKLPQGVDPGEFGVLNQLLF